MASTPVHTTTGQIPTNTEPRPGAAIDGPDHLTATLAEAQAGSQHAFRALYLDLHPRLLRQLGFLVGSTDAPDVASDTWLHIVTGITTFRGGYHSFRSWAAKIAYRRAVDHLRRSPPTGLTAPAEFPDQPAPDNTESDALEAIATAATLEAIKTLSREQHKIILLRVIVGFDAPTTGRILGKHPGAIRTGAHRALHTLADHFPAASSDCDYFRRADALRGVSRRSGSPDTA